MQELIEQCAKFPAGANDDIVDMATQLVELAPDERSGLHLDAEADAADREAGEAPSRLVMACASCGSRASTTQRQQRRLQTNGTAAEWRCETCRGLRGGEPREQDYSFWARRFGVEVPAGATARGTLERVVLASSAPPELARILDELR